MNEILVNGKKYNIEDKWRNNKKDIIVDIKGKPYPYPTRVNWIGREQFINKLKQVETYLNKNKKYVILEPDKNKFKCLLCSNNKVNTKTYILDNILWNDGLKHYIQEHKHKPSDEFINIIYDYKIIKPSRLKIEAAKYTINNRTYLKLERNQIMILDALMKHGGYVKRYNDLKYVHKYKYSEHAGQFDIRNNEVYNIIVSGKTMRVDRGDEEIFLPIDSVDILNYEYIFHTHPPTPKPGGRTNMGILYEFPSLGDLLHFIDNYNEGKILGSIVMTSEGLYNIRTLNLDKKDKININEDEFFNEMKNVMINEQEKAIEKYGSNFTTYKFYSKIAQDMTYIDNINKKLKKYGLYIDYFSRIKTPNNTWIVDTIYLPI